MGPSQLYIAFLWFYRLLWPFGAVLFGIKHGDVLKIYPDHLEVVEKSFYLTTKLAAIEKRLGELRELVQKMWGSLALLVYQFREAPDQMSQRKRFLF